MEVELKKITIRDLIKDYKNDLEEGVVGFAGKLDIRPPYQREFVYNEKQQQSVINTVKKGFPLNIMYWAARDDGTYEIIDGQQRTLSICRYAGGDFAHDNKYFDNLWDEEQEVVLDYKLDVYVCTGTVSEKLDWFKTINIAGEELTEQELRNAAYYGPWVSDAKRHFSKTGCPAFQVGSAYLKGSAIRQDYLETVLKWTSEGNIEEYMGKHQQDENADVLWKYFTNVMEWVQKVFTTYRREMSGLPWGPLYAEYKDIVDEEDFDADKIEEQVKKLMQDEDVTKKAGVYKYILDGNERHLSIRAFSNRERRTAYENQAGLCPHCQKKFDIKDMQADHVIPWSKGGKTILLNLQMLCSKCNNIKSDK